LLGVCSPSFVCAGFSSLSTARLALGMKELGAEDFVFPAFVCVCVSVVPYISFVTQLLHIHADRLFLFVLLFFSLFGPWMRRKESGSGAGGTLVDCRNIGGIVLHVHVL